MRRHRQRSKARSGGRPPDRDTAGSPPVRRSARRGGRHGTACPVTDGAGKCGNSLTIDRHGFGRRRHAGHGPMRISKISGFAVGGMALLAAAHALSRSDGAPRFTDPDLMALETVTARAKRAMDAFILRPRVPDADLSVCVGCLRGDGSPPLFRMARAAVDRPHEVETTSALGVPRPKRPRYAPVARVRHGKRRLARGHGRNPGADQAESWDAELRR